MNKTASTREKIIAVADDLFYQHGFEHTSFADISDSVRISRGNLYHHFKAKDDILVAVIALRIERIRNLLHEWEQKTESPLERIKCFFSFFTTNKLKIKKYGCPVGTLCNELAKLEHEAHSEAVKIYILYKDWIAQQFEAAGHSTDAAQAMALHILSQSQGIAALFNAFNDEEFVKQEVTRVFTWLDASVPAHIKH